MAFSFKDRHHWGSNRCKKNWQGTLSFLWTSIQLQNNKRVQIWSHRAFAVLHIASNISWQVMWSSSRINQIRYRALLALLREYARKFPFSSYLWTCHVLIRSVQFIYALDIVIPSLPVQQPHIFPIAGHYHWREYGVAFSNCLHSCSCMAPYRVNTPLHTFYRRHFIHANSYRAGHVLAVSWAVMWWCLPTPEL